MTPTALHPNGCNDPGCRICHLTAHETARQKSYGITAEQAAAWLSVNEWAREPISLTAPVVRVQLSAPKVGIKSLACVYRGEQTRLVECPTCGQNKDGTRRTTQAKVFACELHGECAMFRKPLAGVRGCASCDDRTIATGETVLISLARGKYCRGLGDCITWAWLANGCDRKMEFCAKGNLAKMLRMFGQTVHDDTIGIDPDDCYLNELQERNRRRPRWQVWYETLGLTGQPKRPIIDVASQKVPGRIGVAPHCAAPNRTWPIQRWVELAEQLRAAGREILWIAEDAGWSYEECARQIASCELLIGNDSMPAHMAGTLEVPALVLFGSTRPPVFAHYNCITPIDLGRVIADIPVQMVLEKAVGLMRRLAPPPLAGDYHV